MSFEKDDRQLRMDDQDNTETITYPQTENGDGAESNTDAYFAESGTDNEIKPGENKSERVRRAAEGAQGDLTGTGRSRSVPRRNAEANSDAYTEYRPAKKRRKALGSKSSFGAPLNLSASAVPRRRERLEEIEEPAKVLRADNGFTGKFTWAENTSPQSKGGAKSAKQATTEIPVPPDAAKITGESPKKALSTRTATERAIKDAHGAPGSTEQPVKSASDLHIKTARTAENTPGTPAPAEPADPDKLNLRGAALQEADKASDIQEINRRAETNSTSRADKPRSIEGGQSTTGSAAKYQSGIGDGVKNIINSSADGLVPDNTEDITAEDSLTLSLPRIDIQHTQINKGHAFKKTKIQLDSISAAKSPETRSDRRASGSGQAPSKVLTALIEKPQILLETPYSVLTKSGPHLRYRLEYGYPDAKIPEQEQSIPGQDFSPLELEAMNRSTPVAEGKKPRTQKKRKSLGREIFGWLKVLAAALILALIIRQFVFVLVWVEGSSMEPTLMNQERIIVTRYDYIFGDPQRQDIVICHFPDGDDKDNYVKRVIGLPGEKIRIDDGTVYINGEALEEPYVVYERIQDMDEITIPEDMYFVMGDNRFNSRDSRVVGLIERSQIQGHVRYVFYPFEDRRSVDYLPAG